MRRPFWPRRLCFGRKMRFVTGLATIAQMLVVVAAPLAERVASDVAAVHMEQAGTRVHHAHGDLCVTCTALHLVAPPARGSAISMAAATLPRPRTETTIVRGWLGLVASLPRAPPV